MPVRILVAYYSSTGSVHRLLRVRYSDPLRRPAAQLKQFIDSAGSLWHEGKLADKPVTAFVSSAEQHGGQEATILSLNNVFYHWGAVIIPLGYTDDIVYAAGGNPYGTSWPAGFPSTMPDETVLECARYQGQRLARFAELLTPARNGSSAVLASQA